MRRAFTLIETLLALMLAAMLMMALLAVKESLSVSQRALDRVESPANVRWERIRKVLYWDLIHATRYSAGTEQPDSGVSIETLACLDGVTRTPHLRPVMVSYSAKRFGKTIWLVRQQRELGLHPQSMDWEDLLVPGIRRLELTPLSQETTSDGGIRLGPSPQVRVTLVPELGTPQEFTLTFR